MIATEKDLDELLSAPGDADREAMRQLAGDLVILGAGGKMGPTLALRARRAADPRQRVVAVSRFTSLSARDLLESHGVETVSADLLEPDGVEKLPDAPNVIYMTGRKFGSSGNAPLTWAMNALAPAAACERYKHSRIAAFSSGNIYPFVPVASGGATEETSLSPVGEYAQSVLARERVFEYHSERHGTPVVLLRLNYAAEMRYGVLHDIGTRVFERRPVDLAPTAVNVIWQGDANSVCLRALALCSSPATVLNLTGPETLSIRYVAQRFGRHFGVDPVFEGQESGTALLNNAARCFRLFGYPSVTAEQMIEWTANWIGAGGASLGKPTHYEVRDGKF